MDPLKKENFIEKQLAEQKGGIWSYWEYKEGDKTIVIRIYSTEYAVDYYKGIDLEDSNSGYYEKDAWEAALKEANKLFKQYEFTGNNI